MKLSELKPGQTAIIKDFSDDDLSLRFLEMGCVPGEEILLERIAPLGDPIAIRVAGYSLCLRFSEAESILITAPPTSPKGRLNSPTNFPNQEA